MRVGGDIGHAAVVVLDAEHGDADIRGALVFAPVADGLHGVAFVEDVVGDQYAPAFQRCRRTMQPREAGAGGGAAIAGGVQVVELEIDADFQRQLRGEQHAAVHHGQIHRARAGVIVADVDGDAGDGAVDFSAIEQQVGVMQGGGEVLGHVSSP